MVTSFATRHLEMPRNELLGGISGCRPASIVEHDLLNKSKNMKVIIIMGSPSDSGWADKIKVELDKWELPSELMVASAHKVPEKVLEIVQKYNQEKDIVYVTIAGRSNGLSGVVAANSIHPVIACPPFKDKQDLLVNIHSSMQMPSETPVLTVLDPNNVAGACARMLGLSDSGVRNKIKDRISEIKKSFE